MQGWGPRDVPFFDHEVEFRFWLADWWRANAEAYKSFVEDNPDEEKIKRTIQMLKGQNNIT